MNKPNVKPANPNFSSGPTSKRPGWDITVLSNALTGRSHRSVECKARLKEAIDKSKVKAFAIAGGVSANSLLRKEVHRLSMEKNISVHIPKFEYCTDNAAMIAMSGLFLEKEGKFSDLEVSASARITMN